MAITPEEARAFTPGEAEFLYQFERSIDLFVRTSGLIVGEDSLSYQITGREKQFLNTKTMNEVIKRYNDAGWNASFEMAGPSPQYFVLVDPNG